MEVVRYETGGGVVFSGGRVLVLRRTDPPELRLPKGHIDPGEDAPTAAVREVLEESGWSCRIIGELPPTAVRFEHDGRLVERTEYYFVMTAVERLDDGESQFVTEWIDPSEAAVELTFEAERARIAQAIRPPS